MRETRSRAAAKTAPSEGPEGEESATLPAEAPAPVRRSRSSAAGDAVVEAATRQPPPARNAVDDQRAPDPKDDELKRRLSEVKLEAGFERVVTTIFSIDVLAEYEDLVTGLKLSMKASDASYGRLVDALDESEERARRASVLFANARVAVKGYKIDVDGIRSALRDAAVAALQREKELGQRSKQITEGDIASEISSRFTDEHRQLELGLERAKRMADVAENLTYRWQERAKDLRQMVAKARDL